jgi:hypothetical protein
MLKLPIDFLKDIGKGLNTKQSIVICNNQYIAYYKDKILLVRWDKLKKKELWKGSFICANLHTKEKIKTHKQYQLYLCVIYMCTNSNVPMYKSISIGFNYIIHLPLSKLERWNLKVRRKGNTLSLLHCVLKLINIPLRRIEDKPYKQPLQFYTFNNQRFTLISYAKYWIYDGEEVWGHIVYKQENIDVITSIYLILERVSTQKKEIIKLHYLPQKYPNYSIYALIEVIDHIMTKPYRIMYPCWNSNKDCSYL